MNKKSLFVAFSAFALIFLPAFAASSAYAQASTRVAVSVTGCRADQEEVEEFLIDLLYKELGDGIVVVRPSDSYDEKYAVECDGVKTIDQQFQRLQADRNRQIRYNARQAELAIRRTVRWICPKGRAWRQGCYYGSNMASGYVRDKIENKQKFNEVLNFDISVTLTVTSRSGNTPRVSRARTQFRAMEYNIEGLPMYVSTSGFTIMSAYQINGRDLPDISVPASSEVSIAEIKKGLLYRTLFDPRVLFYGR